MYHLSVEPLQTDCPSVLYLVRPRIHLMRHLAIQIRADVAAKRGRKHTVLFVPRRALLCEKVRGECQAAGDI